MQIEDLFNTVKERFKIDEMMRTPSFKCPRCSESTPMKTFEENRWVCPECGYHARMKAWDRIAMTADTNTFEETERGKESLAPTSVGRVCTLGLEVELILQRLKILSLNY